MGDSSGGLITTPSSTYLNSEGLGLTTGNTIYVLGGVDPDTNQTVVPSDFMADKLYKQIDLELRAHEPSVLKSYSWFAGAAAKELNVKVDRSWAPEEPHKERKTLLKAAYVNKAHRVQYEMR